MRLLVRGIVQGVGFRPFVKREADERGIVGWVRNTGRGVEINASGGDLEGFLERVREGPALAEVYSVETLDDEVAEFDGFEILGSSGGGGRGIVPPDTATCGGCLEDLRGDGRFAGYWGVSCVECGPRFTIASRPPFDRENTSMGRFPLCEGCMDDYGDPESRRFHAQGFACGECGPGLKFEPDDGAPPIKAARGLLESGGVLAVKGVGGFHLACRAEEGKAVETLRSRTGRPAKPFAVMVPEDQLDRFRASTGEREVLRSEERPIVLVDKSGVVSEAVAPGLRNLGVMLPYTGLHHLLVEEPLVMTSGNLPGRPMVVKNSEALEELSGIADGFLLHERGIVNRCDDSVVRVSGGEPRFLRRSRGWVPLPVEGSFGRVAALGAERDNAVAVSDGELCYPSQHLGNLEGPEGLDFLDEALDRLVELTGVKPEGVACDLHPDFASTIRAEEMAEELGLELFRTQHHHAHVASVMAEERTEQVVGVAADGFGYGPRGEAWGGEVLLAEGGDFERIGGLDYFPLPGGDAATMRPRRVAAGILSEETDAEELLRDAGLWDRETEVALKQARRGVNSPECSSAGRFLDGVAALLGICEERRYDGEPAIRLEATAWDEEPVGLDVPLVGSGEEERVDTSGLFLKLIELTEVAEPGEVAATAQNALARGLSRIALNGPDLPVALSGGVAVNDSFHRAVRRLVESGGRELLSNTEVPPGDGGVCLGQAYLSQF